MTSEEMRERVMELCLDREITVTWCKRISRSYALNEWEEICITPVKSTISYAIALHEVGHILGRHQRSSYVLVRERWAWNWARQNARKWTPAMEAHAQKSFAWYEAQIKSAGLNPTTDRNSTAAQKASANYSGSSILDFRRR
jgi:hypothetical protein